MEAPDTELFYYDLGGVYRASLGIIQGECNRRGVRVRAVDLDSPEGVAAGLKHFPVCRLVRGGSMLAETSAVSTVGRLFGAWLDAAIESAKSLAI